MKIVLASSSPRRKELLNQIGWTYDSITCRGEEKTQETDPVRVVEALSEAKAREIYGRLQKEGLSDEEVLIIGADTVVEREGRIFGKPYDAGDAKRMLEELSGKIHSVRTGVALYLVNKDTMVKKVFSEETRVIMYSISHEEIADYVASGEPLDKAGAYGIQGSGARFIKQIDGDYNNVVGLPVARIYQELPDLKHCFFENRGNAAVKEEPKPVNEPEVKNGSEEKNEPETAAVQEKKELHAMSVPMEDEDVMPEVPWYDKAVFYHIYPLGLCGSAHQNTGVQEDHFDKLNAWAMHAKKIGCSAIYIGPLFESVGHGYETTDYKKVDCRIGTNDQFKEFVQNCHENGIHVVVDGVFNHTGREFFAFQDIKKNREQSRYKNWYCNVNFGGNNEYNDGFSYENWGGYNLLAKLNVWNPEVKNYLFDVVRFWVSEFDIDGIRLDAADVLDMGFMSELANLTKGLKKDFWLMGEVIHGDYGRWANSDRLHSVTNYELHKGLYSGHNDHNYFEIAHTVNRLNNLARGIRLYTFLDNHDVSRIHTKLNNKEHMFDVTLLLYTLPGIPSVYYGSEFGIDGEKGRGEDWNLRPCLELADYKDAYKTDEVLELMIQLGALKKKYKELTEGDYEQRLLTNRQYAFARKLGESETITALNNDDNDAYLEIGTQGGKAELIAGVCKDFVMDNGRLKVQLPANRGCVFIIRR